eukprot:TRINITY_DN997_c0_g1_i2.p1 TRINITY_DN997_c0_g1~~TRINITY_DN997_c0_g1_i2.p1  ORF type:complete len:434 (-),score=102.74 TRINITY_DN997_c0_g1_i2:1587-2888(-)
MECIIPGKSVRLFAKMVSCVAKIGEDLFLEATEEKVTIRTLNDSRSAFVAFHFAPSFFEEYQLPPEAVYHCQVQAKSFQAVFRSILSVERTKLRIDETESRIVLELNCKLGVKKVYRLTYGDGDGLQALYNKEACPNKIVARASLLIESFNNFHKHVEEITMTISKRSLTLKSYFDDNKGNKHAAILNTELTLFSHDFDEYHVEREGVELTFCLKEVKAILSFCEVLGQPVSIFYERGGRPILFAINCYNSLEADFVIATLLDSAGSAADVSPTPDSSASSMKSTRSSMPSSPVSPSMHSSSSVSASPSSSPAMTASNSVKREHNYTPHSLLPRSLMDTPKSRILKHELDDQWSSLKSKKLNTGAADVINIPAVKTEDAHTGRNQPNESSKHPTVASSTTNKTIQSTVFQDDMSEDEAKSDSDGEVEPCSIPE